MVTCTVVNYDRLEGFIDYTNVDSWKEYIKSYVIPLWRNTLILKEFYENLRSEFHDVLLSDVAEKDLPLLLGGIDPRKEEVYRKNSLAKFYSKFFGLKLSDLQSWVLGGGNVGIPLKVIVEETAFTRLVNDVFKWLDRAVHYQTLVDFTEPEVEYQQLKKDPYKLLKLIRDFYQQILGITVNYNYYTFFLWSIKQIPYKFMKAAYPRIDQILEFLEDEFGLTKFNWNPPFSEDSPLYREYTIWCWPEYNTKSERGGYCGPDYSQGRSFGGSICVLNEIIWSYTSRSYSSLTRELKDIISSYFTMFPNLEEDYVSRVKGRVIGKLYPRIYYRGISAAEDQSKVGETNLTIMQMLDEVSPYLFTGLAKIRYVSEGYLEISEI